MEAFIKKLLIRSGLAKGKVKAGQPIYHGTYDEAAAKIKREGFKNSRYGWLGKGVYTTPDKETGRNFAHSDKALMKGRLPPGLRIRDYPWGAHEKQIFGEKPNWSNEGNVFLDNIKGEGNKYKAFVDYDNELAKTRKFRNTDAIRWRIKGEDQILFLDPKVANTAFNAGNVKHAPKSMRTRIDSPRKHLSKDRILNTLKIGSGLTPSKGSGLGSLLKAFVGGQAGASFVKEGLDAYNREKRKRQRPASYPP